MRSPVNVSLTSISFRRWPWNVFTVIVAIVSIVEPFNRLK